MSEKPNSAKPKKVVRKGVAVGIGTAYILLAVGLVGVFAYYVPMENDKNNTISILNDRISSLNDSYYGVLNSSSLPNWITGTTVTLEGNLTARIMGHGYTPDYYLVSGDQSIGVLWHGNVPNNTAGVKVTGFPKQVRLGDPICGVYALVYLLEAETVEPL